MKAMVEEFSGLTEEGVCQDSGTAANLLKNRGWVKESTRDVVPLEGIGGIIAEKGEPCSCTMRKKLSETRRGNLFGRATCEWNYQREQFGQEGLRRGFKVGR